MAAHPGNATGRSACSRPSSSQKQRTSASLWTGFKASRGSVIATLDGDLQNDPADLPALLGT